MPLAQAIASPTEAERIAAAYLTVARGDARAALVQAVADALADLCEAEGRTLQRDRLISRGYVRGGLGTVSMVEPLLDAPGRYLVLACAPSRRRGVFRLDRLRTRFAAHACLDDMYMRLT